MRFFAIACLAFAATARRTRRGSNNSNSESSNLGSTSTGGDLGLQLTAEDTKGFTEYAQRQNKNYKGLGEFQMRQQIWKQSDNLINETNKRGKESGLTNPLKLGHNKFSDMTTAERQKHIGASADSNPEHPGGTPGHLGQNEWEWETDTVDWAKTGHTGPVKDSGECGGAGYAMSTTTSLAARQSIKSGEPPVPVSAQQVLDCAHWGTYGEFWTHGCESGWMDSTYLYFMKYGAMSEEDYPFVSGQTGTIGECMYDADKVVVKPHNQKQLVFQDRGFDFLMDELFEEGPVATKACVNDNWFLYESGLMRPDDCPGNCYNHSVAIVGYGTTANDGHSRIETKEKTVTTCSKQTLQDREYKSGCRNQQAQLIDGRYCCTEQVEVSWFDHNPQDEDEDGVIYFKIQNDWGADWGEKGYMRIARDRATEQWGTCSIYAIPTAVYV